MSSLQNGLNVNDDLGKVSVVLGTQWGDEGKGKVVDLMAADSDVVCRYQVRRCRCAKLSFDY